jgi:hypothetical protein
MHDTEWSSEMRKLKRLVLKSLQESGITEDDF